MGTSRGGRGGACQNLDSDVRPTFLGLKFGQILFFWAGKFLSYFLGFRKFSANFLGLPILVSNTWIFSMKNTQYWKT